MECRGLQAAEKERWFDHVDEVFVHTPRAYFERHFHNGTIIYYLLFVFYCDALLT
jgi:hypothetical protein